MSSVLHKLSKEIGIQEDELVTASLRAYIRSELGKIEAQLHVLYHKYGINSIKDLVESDVFEDLTRIDYLESQLIKLKKMKRNV